METGRRARDRRGKRGSWYRKGGFETAIFVPATPGYQLKTRYIEEIEGAGFKIKPVELSIGREANVQLFA